MLGLVLGTLRLPLIVLATGNPVQASGTNIAVSAAAAGAGGLRHAREGRVDWYVVAWMAPPSVAGAIAGALLADEVAVSVLYGVIAAVLAWTGVDLAFRPIAPRVRERLRVLRGGVLAFFIGVLGGAVGVILGTLRMPALVRSVGLDVRRQTADIHRPRPFHQVDAREHAHGALPVALDAQHALFACGAQQVHHRGKPVLALVEALDRAAQELARLADVHRPAQVRRVRERMLHGANAVLHAHRGRDRRGGRTVLPAIAVALGVADRLRSRGGRRRRCLDDHPGSVHGLGRRRGGIGHGGGGGGAAFHGFDQHAAPGVLQLDGARHRHLFHEVPEAAGAVVAFRERGIELQQRALEQAQLRSDFAFGQHLQGAEHERQRGVDLRRGRAGARLAATVVVASTPAAMTRRTHQVLVSDELVAIALHRRAGELAAAHHQHLAAVLLQLLDQRDEVAVTADDDEDIDVVVGEAHLQGVERHGDVGAVLVAAGGEVALHHADRVLGEQTTVVASSLPIAVGDLGDDFAPFLDGLEDEADIEIATDGGLDADLDVVEVDEDGDAVAVFSLNHEFLPARLVRLALQGAVDAGRSRTFADGTWGAVADDVPVSTRWPARLPGSSKRSLISAALP